MKKTLLILAAVAFSFGNAIAQDAIIDREEGGSGFYSAEDADGVGVYMADYFELDEDTNLGVLTFYGFGAVSLSDNIIGLNVHIYANDDFGAPEGNPSWDPSDAVVELLNISPNDITINETPGGNISTETIVDMTAVNGDVVHLEAGSYWLSVSPIIDGDFTSDQRWNWLESPATPEFPTMMIDPTNLLGADIDFWIPVNQVIEGAEDLFTSMAWKLTEYDALGVDDFETNTFKHLVKDNQLFINSDVEINNVAIYNSLGQQVISQTVNTTSANINLGNLSNGVYFTQANLNGETKTFKFVK